jgi:hypothetical protein
MGRLVPYVSFSERRPPPSYISGGIVGPETETNWFVSAPIRHIGYVREHVTYKNRSWALAQWVLLFILTLVLTYLFYLLKLTDQSNIFLLDHLVLTSFAHSP